MPNSRTRAEVDFVTKYTGRTKMRQLSGDIGSTTRLMKRMAGQALALGGIAGLGYMAKQTMSAIDQVGKMSDELNVSTEALIGWEHAAKLSGSSMPDLHKGLQIFVRRLGEAKMGLGEARNGLDAIGMSAEELAGKGTEGAFEEIANQIAGIEDASERAQIAYAFFGRGGVNLMNMFMAGADGIRTMRNEAESLNMTYSRFDAAKVEALNDAIAQMRGATQGLVNQGIIQAAPYIEAMVDMLTEAATGSNDFGAAVVDASEVAVLGLAKVGREIDKIITAVPRMKSDAKLALLMLQRGATILEGNTAAGKTKSAWTKRGREKATAQYEGYVKRLAEIDKQIGIETDLFPMVNEAKEIGKIEAIFDAIRDRADAAARGVVQGPERPPWSPLIDDGSVEVVDGATQKLRDSTESLTESLNQQIKIYDLVNSKKAKSIEIASFMIQADKAYGEGTTAAADAVERYGIALEQFNALRETVDKETDTSAEDRTAAMARMYGDMDKMSRQSYQAQKILLDQQVTDYQEKKIDQLAIDAWYKEQKTKLDIEAGRSSGNVADGFYAAGLQIEREQLNWSERSYDIAMSTRDIWRAGLMEMARDWENMGEIAMDVLEQIYWKALETAIVTPAADASAAVLTKGIGLLMGARGGGTTTGNNTMTNGSGKSVDFGDEMFANGGIMTSHGRLPLRGYGRGGVATEPQVAVIAEGGRNEAYVPLDDGRSIPVTVSGGAGGGNVQVQVFHVGDGRGKVTTEEKQVDGQRVISVFMHDSQHGGMTAREMKRHARRAQ